MNLFKTMKPSILLFFTLLFLTGCFSTYNFTSDPINSPYTGDKEFKMVKNIYGSSSYTSFLGIDDQNYEGILKEAKTNMYSNHKFSPNQIPINFTTEVSRKIFFIPIFWETSVTIGCDIIEFKGSANDSDFQTYTVRNPNNYQNNLNDSTFINEIFELGDDVEFSLFKERHKGNIIRITKSGKYIIEYYYANGNILSTISLDKKDLRKLPGN